MVQLGEDCDCSDDAWRDLGEDKLISDKVVRRGESSPDSPTRFPACWSCHRIHGRTTLSVAF
jgi:hypothetical protein